MKRLISIFLALVLTSSVGPTQANPELVALVNATWLPRVVDAELMSLAADRAAFQLSYSGGTCGTGSLTHDGATTAEVLACNMEGPARAVEQWLGSPDHNAVLSDPGLTAIGCAVAQGRDLFFVCVFNQSLNAPVVAEPEATTLPNTAVDIER